MWVGCRSSVTEPAVTGKPSLAGLDCVLGLALAHPAPVTASTATANAAVRAVVTPVRALRARETPAWAHETPARAAPAREPPARAARPVINRCRDIGPPVGRVRCIADREHPARDTPLLESVN